MQLLAELTNSDPRRATKDETPLVGCDHRTLGKLLVEHLAVAVAALGDVANVLRCRGDENLADRLEEEANVLRRARKSMDTASTGLARDYVHWASLGSLCEFLPLADNRVTLAEEKDRLGLPVACFSYSQCDNDRKLMRSAQDTMEIILKAAGAQEVITIDRYAHLVGGCRMAALHSQGVVDRNLCSFAVGNLYITDGSVLPTQGSANPALTIMALAARAAEHLIAGSRKGLSRGEP